MSLLKDLPGGNGAVHPDEHLVSLTTPHSFEAERYRALRILLEQRRRDAALCVVAISSPTAGDGKTLTAINLAGSLGQDPEARVLIVDADLRRPSVAGLLGLPEERTPGLVDAILDPACDLEQVVTPLAAFNLSVLPTGRGAASPYEILKSARLGDLLQEARRRYDFVLVDTPPMVAVPDLRLLAKWTDGMLLVVSAHKTPRRLLEEAFYVADPEKILGIVFNNDDRLLSRAYGYYTYGRPMTLTAAPRRGNGAGRDAS
jgi:capsular exopolysaccharide synthesis family protein